MAEHIDRALAFELWQQKVPSTAPWFEVDRREFLKLFGNKLIICLCAKSAASQESGRGNFAGNELPKDIAA